MYAGYVVCMIVAFIKPILSMYVISFSTIALFIWALLGRKKEPIIGGKGEEN